jgi:diacylglycerol kinase family enzyme
MELPRIYRGRPVKPSKAESGLARQLVIESDEEIPYVIDGDLHKQSPGALTVRTGPVLNIIIPEADVDLG